MTFWKQNLGKIGEEYSITYLRTKGYLILQKRFKSKFGEIDIIASKGRKLYFIEVKCRSNDKKGKPYESITLHKIERIKKTAKYFLLQNDYRDYKLSIGAISLIVVNDKIINFKFFENIE